MTDQNELKSTKVAKIFLVAGEASADLHGAALLRELKSSGRNLRCFGVGGKSLLGEGMEISVPAESLNVVGIADWFDRWREVVGAYRSLCALIEKERPDCAILLDLPDLNLRLAKRIHALGIPVIYYISPQVWAWRKYRIRKIRKFVDRMLVVFPFEYEFYRRNQVDVEFVGHPLLDTVKKREAYRAQGEVLGQPRIALLPGSRTSELRHHAPLVVKAVESLQSRFPNAEFRLPVASTLDAEFVKNLCASKSIEFVEGDSREVLKWADVALVASGTATLETAIIGTPFALFYIMNSSSAWAAKHIIRYRGFFGMPNLLHQRKIVQEFIQADASAENVAREITRLIEDEPYRRTMSESLTRCRDLLGAPGASSRAAEQVRPFLDRTLGEMN